MGNVKEMDWRRVGDAIESRIDDLGLTKAEVIRLSGVSDKTLTGYIAGAPIVRADKARGLATALRWTLDSFEDIANGGEPTEVTVTQAVRDEFAEIRAQLEEIKQAISDLSRNLS